jgi:hypothetical protein
MLPATMLPAVHFFGHEVTRMIPGDNPVHGHTYIQDIYSAEDMTAYYNFENILKMLASAQEYGCNAILALASPVMLKALKQFEKCGGKLKIIFQTYPPAIDCFAQHIEEIAEYGPIAIYHQGSTGEHLVETGDIKTYLANVDCIRKKGLPAGMAFHDPDNVQRAERENWGADFYVLCPYNARRNRRGEQSGFITGASKSDLVFYPEDRFTMFPIIRSIEKPVIVIKALAGGQILIGKPKEEHPAVIEAFLRETYESIKPTDLVCVGVFQRDADQLRQNTDMVRRILV